MANAIITRHTEPTHTEQVHIDLLAQVIAYVRAENGPTWTIGVDAARWDGKAAHFHVQERTTGQSYRLTARIRPDAEGQGVAFNTTYYTRGEA